MRPTQAPLRFLATGLLALVTGSGLLLGATLPADAATPAAPAPASVHKAAICSSTPFRSKPSAHTWFRIPAVVTTGSGTLVAFAEKRDTNDTSDTGNFDVVRARSTDSGCTWSAYSTIGDDGTNRVSNPAPVVDSRTGDILLFSADTPRTGSTGKGRGLYLQTSSDDGKTFTPLLSDPIHPAGYKGGLAGPGHAIQLEVSHPGRLVVPVGYRTSAGLYGAYGLYSDDDGASWHVGFDQQDTTGSANYMEGTVAELPTGKLFISYRLKHDGAKAGTARRYAYSSDGGATLDTPFHALSLKIVSVQGSSLVPTGAASNELLFSAPSDPTATLRRDMAVFVSTTAGTSWTREYPVELESTPAAYSDLTQLDPSTVGVLYETGTSTWKERIAFQSIAISSLTAPASVASHVTYQRSAHATRSSAQAKVQAHVKVTGSTAPPGRVTLTAAGAAGTRSVSVQLTYSNHGVRWLTLPKLAKGNYKLTLAYSGNARIKAQKTSAGVLHVVKS